MCHCFRSVIPDEGFNIFIPKGNIIVLVGMIPDFPLLSFSDDEIGKRSISHQIFN